MKKQLIAAFVAVSTLFGLQAQDKKWLDVNYANDGQVYHNLDIYLPNTQKPTYKVVIVIYGSAWYANNMKNAGYQSLAKPLLDNGFAVVSINHRSSGDAVYPAQINDVKAAIRFIRANAKNYQLDPSFIGITGFSSGGHLASMAGTTNGVKTYTVGSKTIDVEGTVGNCTGTSSNVSAVVDWFGPIDFAHFKDCQTCNDEHSPEAALIKGKPADNPDMIALISPTTYLDKSDVPFLVIHGESDNVVPHCQGVNFAAALKEKGLLDEFISVPQGQHGPVTFNDNTFQKMANFFLKKAK
jgi:acetyl esterase/lipase